MGDTGHYSAAGFIEGLPGMVHSRVLRALSRPMARLTAKRITMDDVTDAIAMLRAVDAFDVRDRLEQIPTETLLICGARDGFWTLDMFRRDRLSDAAGPHDHVPEPWACPGHCAGVRRGRSHFPHRPPRVVGESTSNGLEW